MANILLTGGAGFIGSHTSAHLLEAGHSIVILDSFCNSSRNVSLKLSNILGQDISQRLNVIEGDIRNRQDLNRAFSASPNGSKIDAVIHFAGLKSVSESIHYPLEYWDVNVSGTCQLLLEMTKANCKTIVFSSSCTVYGAQNNSLISEKSPIRPINPYGKTKAAVEDMLSNIRASKSGWRTASLRYFNPAGAHPSGFLGEDPMGKPSNLFPLIGQVLTGKKETLEIFGDDWPTPDGTCIRDYVHVTDLVEGHIAALSYLMRPSTDGLTVNLGTGHGYSVLQIIHACQEVVGRKIPYQIAPRRLGDAPSAIADPTFAFEALGWKSKQSLHQICHDFWHWLQLNSPLHL